MIIYSNELDKQEIKFIVPASLFQMHSLHYVYMELWLKQVYNEFPIKDEVIIDVGALFGDSCIWFIRNGAKFVTMYEPGQTHGFISLNMAINEITQDKYKLVNAAVTGKTGLVTVTSDCYNFGETSFERDNIKIDGGDTRETLSLIDIVVQDAILKFDTEGSEYQTFELSDRETIRKLKAMMIEFHDKGWGTLSDKIAGSGFEIRIEPNEGLTIDGTRNIGSGMLYARRID